MKGCNTWSYRPYRPYFWEVGDIYICRVAPGEKEIHFEWLAENITGEMCGAGDMDCSGEKVRDIYEIFYRVRDEDSFQLAGSTNGCGYTIAELEPERDYEFFVKCGEKKSRVRLARTGKTIGTVVNYLHPEDDAYLFSGRYLCSPSLVRHPDGYLLASMDVFANGMPQNLTLIFRSDDDGESWHYVSELMPCFWGKLFIHKGELYMLSVSTEFGDLLIGKSADGGKTFSAPTVLLRGFNGKMGMDGVHKNPQNILRHNGRIYETLEWGSAANPDHLYAAMVMSCDENDDLLKPESWSFSEPVKFEHFAPELKELPAPSLTMEGTLALSPEGKLLNIMRFAKRGSVIAYEVNNADHDAPLTYSHLIEMPVCFSKFMIKFDPVSKKYYSIVSRLYEGCEHIARNYLVLMASEDLKDWHDVCDLYDFRNEDWQQVGLQYVDFEIEGEDIIYLCRTAINGAHNFHDANYSTFHRIRKFREL